jgi:hypothetical protein
MYPVIQQRHRATQRAQPLPDDILTIPAQNNTQQIKTRLVDYSDDLKA